MTRKKEGGSRDARGRFRKGHSGHREGRKRKPPRAESSFDIVLDEKVTVTEGAAERELNVEDAMQLCTLKDALAGVRSAEREVLSSIVIADNAIAAREAKQQKRASVDLKLTYDPTNADAALQLLGIAVPVEVFGTLQLRLATWASQMALSRRRGGQRLTEREISEIKRRTDAPHTLRWPRGYQNDDE